MTSPAEERGAEIAGEFRGGSESSEPVDVNLEEFGAVYGSLTRDRGTDPLLRVVSLQDRLVAQFPEVSKRLLYVTLGPGDSPRASLSFVPRLDWIGPEGPPLRWRTFLREEWRSTWRILLPLVACVLTGLLLVHDLDLMESMNRLALTSLSIFLSIFGVFVISESKRLTGRGELFASGRTHEFIDIDRGMLNLALIALLLGFVNAAMLSTDNELTLVEGVLDRSHVWAPILTCLVLVLLVDLFVSIPRYYLPRLRVLLEADAVRDVLGRDNDRGGTVSTLPRSPESREADS